MPIFHQNFFLISVSSPVNSYLSHYKSTRNTTRSAPASSSKFSTTSSNSYFDSRKLGPTNLTIFNEIHEKRRTHELRSELRKKQLDYSKRVNFQHRTTGLEEMSDVGKILGKLRKNIEVATESVKLCFEKIPIFENFSCKFTLFVHSRKKQSNHYQRSF